jgi:hypothetical protein
MNLSQTSVNYTLGSHFHIDVTPLILPFYLDEAHIDLVLPAGQGFDNMLGLILNFLSRKSTAD